ncbi:MAG: SDR family oxidoreductase [Planctomycetes bacterium]|nr:SDR family oxidoreductase [Planctomycetota bacterium]
MRRAMRGIDLFRLDGRVALVTGGSRGLGRSIAEGLASAGADVVLCSRKPEEAAAAAREIAASTGRKALGLGCDVTREEDVTALVERTFAGMGRIDILVNNAGINIRGPIEELSAADFRQVLETNAVGPWLASRAVLPVLRAAGWGRIINVASVLSAIALPNRSPYAASKGAVAMLTKVLALECAPQGITVNAICPGPFLTEMNAGIKDSPDTTRSVVGGTALGRWGELHEIQGAAIYLASPASSYVTGSLLFVDGGWTAR